MPTARCSTCDINFPYDKTVCPLCGGDLWQIKRETHQTDWKAEVDRRAEGTPNLDIPIVKNKDGYLFVTQEALEGSGTNDVTTGTLLKIEGKFYEVGGPFAHDTDVPSWWIEAVELVWDYDKHPVMTEFEYEELEERRGRR